MHDFEHEYIYIWKGTHEAYNMDHLEVEQRTGMKRKEREKFRKTV